MLKILHVPFTYYPDPVGGTEIYVKGVSEALIEQGFECAVAAPAGKNCHYEHDGVQVFRYRVTQQITSKEALYGQGDADSAKAFAMILDEFKPSVVNFHALTRGVSFLHLCEAKSRGIKVVFTYHTPTVSCIRGTMMRWGSIPCDGAPTAFRCTACVLHKHGLPKAVAYGAASMGQWMPEFKVHHKMSYVLQMFNLVSQRQKQVSDIFKQSDHIVAVCEWVEKLILLWSVNKEKLSMIRQGLYQFNLEQLEKSPQILLEKNALNLAYFGRIDRTKGLEYPIQAMRNVQRKISLHIFGIIQEADYERELKKMTRNHHGIVWHNPVNASQVVPLMKQFDAIVIPSVWLETGPLVAYEAAAAGVPVIGHDIGGLAEIVDSNSGSVLLERNVIDWVKGLQSFKAGLPDVNIRALSDVGQDLAQVYIT